MTKSETLTHVFVMKSSHGRIGGRSLADDLRFMKIQVFYAMSGSHPACRDAYRNANPKIYLQKSRNT